MANKYYREGEERGQGVRDLFATIAPRYDFINDLQSGGLHRWWKRRAVAAAAIKPGDRALDVCCGTGDLALALARRGAQVTALDFSEPMLQVARRRKGAEAVTWMQGDALELPFPSRSFQAVTVGYGLRNLRDWRHGLSELFRVAAPGGRIVSLDFGKPDWKPWRLAYFAYLRHIVPVFSRCLVGDAATHAYILESLEHFPAQHGIASAMRDQGARDVRIESILGGVMAVVSGRKPA